jgi:putative transposase
LVERRWLYNRLLTARRDAWQERQDSLRLYDQKATLPALKAEWPALAQVNAQVLHNVAVRTDQAFQAFFRRCNFGEAPGYPRFRGMGRYASVIYPQPPSGCKLAAEAERIRLHGVGEVRITLHRPVAGAPKTATVSRSSTGK